MIKSFFRSKKWFWWAYGIGFLLFSLLYIQVELSVKFNDWYGGFYNILQKTDKHTYDEFYQKLIEFTYLALWYILVITITNYITRIYSLRWREAITFDYIPRWRNVEEEIEGASQRIQEDAYRFAKIIESLGLRIVRAIMTLVAFLPILWTLSKGITVPLVGDIPGSLVWTALIVSLGGTIISWFVGYYLPKLEYNNQVVEAAFRKELVYGEDDKINHALTETLTELFVGIKFNYHRLFWHYGYFDLWANIYNQIMVVIPFIIAGPSLFLGGITLGVLIQISNAFGKIENSFGLFIDNWTTITELRSIWRRLHEFEANLDRFRIRN